MLNLIKKESNMALTENGAAAYEISGSDCLDLFASVGGLRCECETEIISRFVRAYTEDANLAMKLLFFARDIRGGLGERRVFRTILRWLSENEPESVTKNLHLVSEYGRFDDLLILFGTPCENEMVELIRNQLEKDLNSAKQDAEVSLLAKWLPSVNASNKETVKLAKKLAKALGMNDASYRKALVMLRAKIKIIENNLREKDYSFDYEKQPSRAMFKYKRAFARNDKDRYAAFLNRVVSGESKLNADNVSPYELIAPYLTIYWHNSGSFLRRMSQDEKDALNATWNSLPDYGLDENAIAVIDTSGSMYSFASPMPAAVALSLGLYFAEHNTGSFKNHFIEFSDSPKLIEIKGDTFVDRLRYLTTFCEIGSTNLDAVFDLILNAAVKNGVSTEDMPSKLIIISDMEFNECVDDPSETNFENAKRKYEAAGYDLPEIVFWNVNCRNRHQPVTMNEQGVCLVSGASPKLFEMVAGGNLNPYAFMMQVLGSERYANIAA